VTKPASLDILYLYQHPNCKQQASANANVHTAVRLNGGLSPFGENPSQDKIALARDISR
jgi:hypothetical protein